jgi:hypothetical protein
MDPRLHDTAEQVAGEHCIVDAIHARDNDSVQAAAILENLQQLLSQ